MTGVQVSRTVSLASSCRQISGPTPAGSPMVMAMIGLGMAGKKRQKMIKVVNGFVEFPNRHLHGT
jgi:hypothetical protein